MSPHDSPTTPPALTAKPTFGALLRAASRRWIRSLVVAALLGGGAGYLVWQYVPPRFNAEVRLVVKRAPAGVAEPGVTDAATELRSQADLLKNAAVLQLAAEEPEMADIALARGWSAPAAKIGAAITTDVLQKDSVVRIHAAERTASEAIVIARSVANGYLRELKSRREKYVAQLKEALEKEMQPVVVKETPTLPETPRPVVNPRLAEAEKELAAARAARTRADVELAALRTTASARPVPAVSETVVNEVFVNDPVVQSKRGELKPIEEVISKTIRIAVLGEKEPSLVPYLERRDAIEKELAKRRDEIRKALEQVARDNTGGPDLRPQIKAQEERIAAYVHQEQALQDEIKQLRAAPVPVVVVPKPAVHVEKPVDSEVRRRLEAELRKAELEGVQPFWVTRDGKITVAVDEAGVQRRQTLAGAGGGVGVLLGILLVGLGEFRTRRVCRAKDLEDALGLQVLGALPQLKATTKALDAPGKARDAVDGLRVAVLESAADGPCVVVVTGSNANDGSTPVAAHLAASLARSWHKTVLIEADPRPSLFHIAAGPGLAEVLRGEAEAIDAVQPTALNRLWVLPAGRTDAASLHSLVAGETVAVLTPLRDQFDCVIVNAAGLGTSETALRFGPFADVVLLAVQVGRSRLPEVHAAFQQLETAGVMTIGAAVLGAPGESVRHKSASGAGQEFATAS